MCLAIPASVESIDTATDTAIVRLGGIRKQVSLALVDNIAKGDYVLIHVGYVLSRLSELEAKKTLALFAAAGYPCERDGLTPLVDQLPLDRVENADL